MVKVVAKSSGRGRGRPRRSAAVSGGDDRSLLKVSEETLFLMTWGYPKIILKRCDRKIKSGVGVASSTSSSSISGGARKMDKEVTLESGPEGGNETVTSSEIPGTSAAVSSATVQRVAANGKGLLDESEIQDLLLSAGYNVDLQDNEEGDEEEEEESAEDDEEGMEEEEQMDGEDEEGDEDEDESVTCVYDELLDID